MSTELEKIDSIINGFNFAKDKDRVFTYIEFVKMFGFEHSSETFITFYKEYVTRWANTKNEELTLSIDDFVLTKLIEILKSITLDYSSYEEQDFIANIDLTDKDHLKALIAIYSRKIRQITEFYRKKRNESVLIVNRNSFKGAAKSIQEIIYEKVFDYLFSDRNIVPSYVDIKRDLLISVENYVDVYSEYFDIPRDRRFTDKTRAEMLTANINDVDYRMYLEIDIVVSEILYSGNVFLEEIPLIAQLGIDLSQNCVGDMLALKNNLMANTTINQVPLTEQVALKRRLYEKFLGCDLYYMYVDLQGNIQMDVLCRADNPSGNLLNCGTADTATVENEQLELLSHIGLFFKPDKTSILKVNAKSFEWSIDMDKIQPDTMYVFPDPTKYGDIGNNKSSQYPLIMEYKLDYDVKNMSSGESCDDPLMYIADQGWRSYYSKQDDDFKLIDNNNYEYSFTYLANQGFLHKFQTDVWGNQFGILKGCAIEYNYDENNNIISVKSVTLPKNYSQNEFTFNGVDGKHNDAILLNGGYFEDPFHQGEVTKVNDEYIWTFQGNPGHTRPFNFSKALRIGEYYNWSGVHIKNESLFYSDYTNNSISFGSFGDHNKVQYTDNFQYKGSSQEYIEGDEAIIKEVLLPFMSKNVFEDPDYEIKTDVTPWEDYDSVGGDLYIKMCNSLYSKPQKFEQVFDWVDLKGEKITNIHVIHETIIIETNNTIKFVPYSYNGEKIINTLGLREMFELDKSKFHASKVIYIENERKFYIVQIDSYTFDGDDELSELSAIDSSIKTKCYRRFLIPRFYQFDPKTYTMKDVVHLSDPYYLSDYENGLLNKTKLWSQYVAKKEELINEDSNYKLKVDLLSQKDSKLGNFRDFEIYYNASKLKLENFDFTYNSSLGIFLLSLSIHDTNNTPYIYEYKFKLNDVQTFNDSLRTNVYTIKNDGVNFRWNDKINPYLYSSYPNNFKTLGENSLFEYNEKNDFGEGDSYFNGKKYKAKFDLVENDYERYDKKFHVGHDNDLKWVETIDDTYGNDVKCHFSSDCFISDGESVFERQERIKTACDLKFTIDDYIRCGENECTVVIRKLEAEGLMNRQYPFLTNGDQPFLGEEYEQNELWYEVFLSRDLEQKMTLHADAFGNVCGNCTIQFENNSFRAVQTGYMRSIKGELRLCLYGTAKNIIAEAHMNVFDITAKDENIDIEYPENPEYPDVPDNPEPPPSINYDVSFENGYIPDASQWNSKVYNVYDLVIEEVINEVAYNDKPDTPTSIYDVSFENGYIPDASQWNSEIYNVHDLVIEEVIDEVAYNDKPESYEVVAINLDEDDIILDNELVKFNYTLNLDDEYIYIIYEDQNVIYDCHYKEGTGNILYDDFVRYYK